MGEWWEGMGFISTEENDAIGYAPDGMENTLLPQLTFKVCWLEDFGFTSDQSVIVTAERGELVIEVELKF